jgi:DNA-binding SARP family transcriptional activator
MVWISLLGPMGVRAEGDTLVLSAGKHRSLLGALVVAAGDVVSFDRLAEVVWDGSPPRGARVALRNYVMRLRQILGPEAGARVVTLFPGYLFRASEEEVDLLAFERLCRDGHAAARARDWQRSSEFLADALRLCRGTPLADIPSQVLRDAHVPHLEEARLAAWESRIECELQLGRSSQIAAEVSALAAKHPMRERLQALLIRVLDQQGRQADALAAFMRTRKTIVEQLGIEPGHELRDAQRQILAGHRNLPWPGDTRALPARDPGPATWREPVRHQGIVRRPGPQAGHTR